MSNPTSYVDPDGHQATRNHGEPFRQTVYGEVPEWLKQQWRDDATRRFWDAFVDAVLFKRLSDFSAGVGDALTGRMIPGVDTSVTEALRQRWGTDTIVSKGTVAYKAGDFTGGTVGWSLVGSASATAAAMANGKNGRLFGRGVDTVFNSSKVRFGWYWKGTAATGRDVIGLRIGPARGTSWWSHIPFWYPK